MSKFRKRIACMLDDGRIMYRVERRFLWIFWIRVDTSLTSENADRLIHLLEEEQ